MQVNRTCLFKFSTRSLTLVANCWEVWVSVSDTCLESGKLPSMTVLTFWTSWRALVASSSIWDFSPAAAFCLGLAKAPWKDKSNN